MRSGNEHGRLILFPGIHGAMITGDFGGLIDRYDSTSNDKIVYGLGVNLAYFTSPRLSVDASIESSWWSGELNIRALTLALAGHAFLRDSKMTSPYAAAQTGFLWDDLQDSFVGRYLNDNRHWFYRLGLGMHFVSSRGHISHLELFYKTIPVDFDKSALYGSIFGEHLKLTYWGMEIGFGIPL